MSEIWGDELIIERRTEFGSAAHGNRGRYSGQKIHRLRTAYVVGVVESASPRPGTLGARFLKTGKEQLFSARPACGVTQGQWAGQPFSGMTEANITCTKCQARS